MSSASQIDTIRQIKRGAEKNLAGRANTVAVGIGYKISQGVVTNELAVIVSVRHKVPLAELAAADIIPKSIDGARTDVVETGDIVAFQDPRAKMRPARPGVSLGHFQITAGTFGCLVRKGGQLYLLSNNHVLANSNAAQVGDPVWQPGRADNGTSADQIGALAEFVPLAFDGETPPPPPPTGNGCSPLAAVLGLVGAKSAVQPQAVNVPGDNKVDCALARPTTPDLVNADILDIGVPAGVGTAALGLAVQKSGRTTGYTTGTITQIDVRVSVNYGGPIATFTNQLMA
ncbi:MAG: hypothetical protein KA764_16130, partial [Anaerolineales bacterium]|nr:hypothetical protein [Anaerolineales bacterium]